MYRDIPPRSCSAKWCRKATWPGKRKETLTFWKRWDISDHFHMKIQFVYMFVFADIGEHANGPEELLPASFCLLAGFMYMPTRCSMWAESYDIFHSCITLFFYAVRCFIDIFPQPHISLYSYSTPAYIKIALYDAI